jgi:hypothetical protein
LNGLNIGFVFFIAFVKESDFKANIVASFLVCRGISWNILLRVKAMIKVVIEISRIAQSLPQKHSLKSTLRKGFFKVSSFKITNRF